MNPNQDCPRYPRGPECKCLPPKVVDDQKTLCFMAEYERVRLNNPGTPSCDTPSSLPLRYEGPC